MSRKFTPIVIVVLLLSVTAGEQRTGRIAGGSKVTEGEIPWQVSIQNSDGAYWCGGVIISPDFVLTSAECASRAPKVELMVGAGSVEWQRPLSVHHVTKSTVHPNFDPVLPDASYDIAILEVMPSFHLGPLVEVVKMPEEGSTPPEAGTLATFSGWGSLEWSGPTSDVLLKAEVVVADEDHCASAHQLSEGVFCSEVTSSNQDPCQNDAGGPLTMSGSVLVGLLSRGFGCHQLVRSPALYVDVAFHRAWINQETGV